MYLIKLIYASRCKNNISDKVIEDILATASRYNSAKGISGMLCYDTNFFLQCLEGSRRAVNELYSRILHDPRHESPVILQYEVISVRDFSEWEMAYVELTEDNKEKLYKFGLTDVFDPYSLSGDSANQLLISLKHDL
ncbi:MAG: BLUF domain-containing protein [Oceanospirillales bacterium]|nr:MAG: BLUF domain-containing protein [Oceanospirillales bacterium]